MLIYTEKFKCHSDLTQALADEKVCSVLQMHSAFYSVAHGKLGNRGVCRGMPMPAF